MFKKLKQKIEETSSLPTPGKGDGERGPGLASPVKVDSPGGPGLSRSSSIRDIDTTSISSGVSDVKTTTSKEEVLQLLMKRTDQVRKLEGKIVDLAAMIKERNRNIDKLETALERAQDDAERKLQEKDKLLQTSRLKITEAVEEAQKKKELEMKDKMGDIDKARLDLEERLKEAQLYRDKFFKSEEENDEFQGLTTQELAKVKHMLLITQEELNEKKKILEKKTTDLELSGKENKNLQNEVKSLMEQIGTLTIRHEEMGEELVRSKSEVARLSNSSKQYEESSSGLAMEMSEIKAKFQGLEEAYTDLQNDHQILQRQTDIHKNKMTTVCEEKDETIKHLTERTKTLEQRLQDNHLSGDERITALEAERSSLEAKLSESREQLSQVKTSWSDKIAHLEQQISHLNTKMAEDGLDLSNSKKETQTVKESMQKQVEELQKRLTASENIIKEKEHLVQDVNTQMEQQKSSLQEEIIEVQQNSSELVSQLTQQVSTLESQLSDINKTRIEEKERASKTISKLENNQEDWLEKQLDTENQISKLENQVQRLKDQISNKDCEVDELNKDLDKKIAEYKELSKKFRDSESSSMSLTTKVTELTTQLDKSKSELDSTTQEKDTLMLRNAQLSQECETSKKGKKQELASLEEELKHKDYAVGGLEASIKELTNELHEARAKVKELESQQMAVVSEIESDEINRLNSAITDLEKDVLDKNKTIKIQQQRLQDLKKTLQRELKVQALPNDEALELPQATSNGRDFHKSHIQVPLHALNDIVSHKRSHSRGKNDIPSALEVSSSSTVNDPKLNNVTVTNNTSEQSRSDKLEYQRDINFEYLRHVVLKFMLSREAEAIHLIKAIAVLLDFTPDEEKLLQETLEWKMSWGFTTRPALTKGQLSKILPPQL